MTQKRGLGRGLGALIPGAGTAPAPGQDLRTRSHPRTSPEAGEKGSSTRPVDMFFSGEPVHSDSDRPQRERAAKQDLAGDMARAAAERRGRGAGGTATSRSTSSPARRTRTAKSSPAGASAGSGATESESSKDGSSRQGTATKSASKAGTSKGGTSKAGTSKAGASATGSSKAGASKSRRDTTSTAGQKGSSSSRATTSTTTKPGRSTSPKPADPAGTQQAPAAEAPSEETPAVASPSAATEPAQSGSADAAPVEVSAPVAPSPIAPAPVEEDSTVSETPGESPAVDVEEVQSTPVSVPRDTSSVTETAQPDTASKDDEDADLVPVPGAEFAEVPIHEIRENPRNPRTMFDEDELDELAESLQQVGVLQPVVVRPISVTEDGESFELVMGERRWRAARRAGLDRIPAIIRETRDDDLLRDALLENLHRSQLNPLEEAAAYQQLLEDFGCTQEELAERIGRSRPQITNTLRLMRLPALVQRRLASGAISAGHARALLSLDDPSLMEELAQRIVQEGLSVRAVERLVARGAQPTVTRTPRRSTYDPHVVDITSRLSNRLEAPVRIDVGKRKGKITLEFSNIEDLERLVERIGLELPAQFDGNDQRV